MELEFKNGERMIVDKILSIIVNVLFVRSKGDYYLVNRHGLVGKYGIDEVKKDE